MQIRSNNHEMLGDSIAWGGCMIIHLLGQRLHFEFFDSSYQVFNIAKVNSATNRLKGQVNFTAHVKSHSNVILMIVYSFMVCDFNIINFFYYSN